MDTNIGADILRRRPSIDFNTPRLGNWSGRGKAFETYLNALSFLFPPGEAFFVSSVKYYENRITDPVLKDQAQRFIFQEAMHSRVHASCNRALSQTDAYGAELASVAKRLLAVTRRFSTRSAQLATTCALEHFTAMLADGLLRNQDGITEQFDPAFAALWLWHAVEETEHKGVCFDVYQHVCGKGVIPYLHRVVVMGITSLLFIATLAVAFTVIKRRQKRQRAVSGAPPSSPRVWFLLRAIPMRMYLDYYRWSFHPWNHDNTHLIDKWKAYYADFGQMPQPAEAAMVS